MFLDLIEGYVVEVFSQTSDIHTSLDDRFLDLFFRLGDSLALLLLPKQATSRNNLPEGRIRIRIVTCSVELHDSP